LRADVIICAAGKGKRMGVGKNKMFLELNGVPLFIHTLRAFEHVHQISGVVLVVGHGEVEDVQYLLKKYKIHKVKSVIPGGNERQDSVYQGLLAMKHSETPDIVLIHDGARPFVTKEEIEKVTTKALEQQAAVLGVPIKDTVKRIGAEGCIEFTLNREWLLAVQTPQAFSYPLILRAHEEACEAGLQFTDDAALVERLGLPVHIVQGSYHNMKVTTPEDIDYAEYLLRRRG
jgi:2-C-methyl-D-erythritol 4-phosphate cytidylyltransferase